jgi:hypothetical protein
MDFIKLTKKERELIMDFINSVLDFEDEQETQRAIKDALLKLQTIHYNKEKLN